ncbi:glycosyltransferase [Octadecabacter sp.]|nr:glycosyltransferase [Octadecabacter sp.]
MTKLIKDDIILRLQKGGGISFYWEEVYNGICEDFDILTVNDPFWRRYNNVRYSSDSPHLFHSSYYRVSTNKLAINITTVHDFVYEYFARGLRKSLHAYQKRYALENSKGIICISENTKKDLLKLYPQFASREIVTIYNGFNTLDIEPKRVTGIFPGEEFYLFVGSRAHYKNFFYAANIAKLSKIRLVIVGGGALTNLELKELTSNECSYYHLAWAEDCELKWLYKNALALLYPSQYEGFGMPPLEALYQGCFPFCLDTPSNQEIYGEYIPLCEVGNPSRAVDFIGTHLRKGAPVCRTALHKKFNWKKCSAETAQFLKYQNSGGGFS